jgi:G3E family GTPase
MEKNSKQQIMLPVNIISGFLGSGKTTVILQLLGMKQPDERWAIVVNEFGKIAIDGSTLRAQSVEGSVFDIVGGCICCSARIYLRENLENIIEAGCYDRILIEPSGLGGAAMVSEIVESVPALKLMPVICMVDITCRENPLIDKNWIYQSQIRKSERIVFSKCDLLKETDPAQKIEQFKTLYPGKELYLTGRQLSISVLYPGNAAAPKKAGPSSVFGYAKDEEYKETTIVLGAEYSIDLEKLSAFLEQHPSVVRAKGYLQTGNGWTFFNYTLSGAISETCAVKDKNELVIIAQEVFTADEIGFTTI